MKIKSLVLCGFQSNEPLRLQSHEQQKMHLTPKERLKCGEVFTWNCAGEQYGIECALCEKRPICTLAEFAEHMQIWHNAWADVTVEILQNDLEVRSVTNIYNGELSSSEVDDHEHLEPFEEVFIDHGEIHRNEINTDTNMSEPAGAVKSTTTKTTNNENIIENDCEAIIKQIMEKITNDHCTEKQMETNGNANVENSLALPIQNIAETSFETMDTTTEAEPNNKKTISSPCNFEENDINGNEIIKYQKEPTKQKQNYANNHQHHNSSSPETFARLSVEQTHNLIGLYKQYTQLWDPNNLDYNSRTMRHIAWHSLTSTFNAFYKLHYSWKTLQRKLSDYIKYYRREKQRIKNDEARQRACIKWCFYEDFTFLNDLNSVIKKVPKAHQQHFKQENQKIITIYKDYPQLWNTQHPDYTKHKQRQRNMEAICIRLQNDYDIEMTPKHLKQRLSDFRCRYRAAKLKRITALERSETFTSNYELYEDLQFLDKHLPPFNCDHCNMSLKRPAEFQRHMRKQHNGIADSETTSSSSSNVCHICGIKFTLRSNLLCHLKRHLGVRKHACSLCPKTFFNTTALHIHERTHTKEYPYVCELCGRAFINGSKLTQHQKRHRNQRTHQCEHCNKAFYSAVELDRHVRCHLNIRDKMCPICGRTFVIGSSYYTHMLLHSDVKRFSCDVCDMRFVQYAGLYKHRKKYHKP